MTTVRQHIPSPNKIHISALFWFFLFFGIFTTSGIYFTFQQNEIIDVRYTINETKKENNMYRNEGDQAVAEIAELLGYFPVKERLAAHNSTLVSINKLNYEVLNEDQLKQKLRMAIAARKKR